MAENLNDDHRGQVLDYAIDKGGKLRQFGLTNGDRWELYELVDNEPLQIFEFSILRESASDCAELLFSYFPRLSSPNVKSSENITQSLQTAVHNVETVPPASGIHTISTRRLTNNVDVPKVLTWLGVILIIFGTLGWAIGVWNAQPIEGFFECVGLFAILIGLLATRVLVRRLFPSAVPVVLRILGLKSLFAPINGNRRRTLIWVAFAIVCGIGTGSVGGYFIGLQTGQSVVDVLDMLGKAITFLVVGVIVLLVLMQMERNSRKRQRGKWRPRYSYRKKR